MLRRLRIVRYDRDNHAIDIRTNRPEMKIGNAIVIVLNGLLDSCSDMLGALFVEQYGTGGTQQTQ